MDTDDAGRRGSDGAADSERVLEDIGAADQPGRPADRGADSEHGGGRRVISRADARAAGLKRYFTGEPCRNGHVAERMVVSYLCIACHKEWRDARFQCDDGFRRDTMARKLKYARHQKHRNQVRRAAKMLAELTGVPHEIVKTPDGTWQPRPKQT